MRFRLSPEWRRVIRAKIAGRAEFGGRRRGRNENGGGEGRKAGSLAADFCYHSVFSIIAVFSFGGRKWWTTTRRKSAL
ncbi:MAG: hypothetical protein ACR2QC_05320 [Gammaproteobacteria bacterium]